MEGGAHIPHSIKNPWDRLEYRIKRREVSDDPKYRLSLSIASKKQWSDPIMRDKIVNATKLAILTPESKAKRSQIFQDKWKESEYREHVIIGIKDSLGSLEARKRMSLTSQELWNDPNYAAKQQASSKRIWVDYEYRAKQIQSIAVNSRDPVIKAKISDASKMLWKDDEYQAKVSTSVKETLRVKYEERINNPDFHLQCRTHGYIAAKDCYKTDRNGRIRLRCKLCSHNWSEKTRNRKKLSMVP